MADFLRHPLTGFAVCAVIAAFLLGLSYLAATQAVENPIGFWWFMVSWFFGLGSVACLAAALTALYVWTEDMANG